MKNFAIGWACNLNDLFVRFPYEKCKSLLFKTKAQQRQKVKQVFREGVNQILNDIIENNNTFKIQGVGYQKGEIHMEAITGSDFEKVRKKGKFQDVDLYIYVGGKRDNFLYRRKFPIYVGKILKDKLTKYTNQGKVYC